MTDLPIVRRLTRRTAMPGRPFKSNATMLMNPDGPEAAELLTVCVEALEAMCAGSEMLARHYKIDLCNDVENGSAYHKARSVIAKARGNQ